MKNNEQYFHFWKHHTRVDKKWFCNKINSGENIRKLRLYESFYSSPNMHSMIALLKVWRILLLKLLFAVMIVSHNVLRAYLFFLSPICLRN